MTIVLALIILSVGAILKIAPNFSYVYSESMEPIIMTNDGFLVLPVIAPKIGDIVLYRPLKLEAELITHRIIGIGEYGFITKGDNSISKDQDVGEPEVKSDRIVGRVFTIGGNPLIIRGFGQVMANMKERLGAFTDYLAGGLVMFGVVLGLRELWFPKRKRKSRHRWRLRDVYRVGAIVVTVLALSSILFSSSFNQVRYLVSEDPGTLGDHVLYNEPGELALKVKNAGFLPVWLIPSGVQPLSVAQAPSIIPPLAQRSMIVAVLPHKELGWYRGYVRNFYYPALFPRAILVWLHRISPFLAFTATGIALYLWLKLYIFIFERVLGLEGWIPLYALKNKASARRLQRFRNTFLGRGRSRK